MIRISGRCPSFLLLFAGLFSIAGLVPPAGAQIEKWMPQEPDADYRHASPAAIEAWKDRKFGMRIHWGVYSVLGIEASWPMIVVDATSDFRQLYSTLYEVFNPTDFDAEEWAALAQRAGMTYFVITTKHHDGFSMWDTRTKVRALRRRPGSDALDPWYISYSIMDTSYRKDIVGALAQAFHKRGLGVGFYYSHIDWNDPDFRWDKFSPLYDPDYTKESDPEAWARFRDIAGAEHHRLPTDTEPPIEGLLRLYSRLMENPDPGIRARTATQWLAWEDAVISTESNGRPGHYSNRPDDAKLALARICAHYYANDAFLEDGVLISEAGKLAGIPGILVHGRNDLGGPVITAWELARAWPGAELIVIEDSGHTGSAAMQETLHAAGNRLLATITERGRPN